MCSNLERHGLLATDAAAHAFSRVDRLDFVPLDRHDEAYLDAAVPLGAGSQMSAPHIHARALDLIAEALPNAPTQRLHALDLGAGSGYMSALLAEMISGHGDVVGFEHIEELACSARDNVAKHHSQLLEKQVLDIACEDARCLLERKPEYSEHFDIIHCGAALLEPPVWLLELLRPGGRAVLPLGSTDTPQWLSTVDKAVDGSITVQEHMRVLYVPIISAEDQRERGRDWDTVVERCMENSTAVLGNVNK
jgi:protein-L-isoaspartate(D-aspartate) O-methyltransferase